MSPLDHTAMPSTRAARRRARADPTTALGPLGRLRLEARRRRAFERALRRFRRTRSRWHASGFDPDLFASSAGRAAIAEHDASALARAWTQRFSYRDERVRERDVRLASAVAASFLAILAEEEVAAGVPR